MRQFGAGWFAILLGMFNGGCAYFTNYTSSVDLENSSYVMDVKQRVVFSSKRKTIERGPEQNQNVEKIYHVICAEPSPDALTTISASAGLDFLSNIGVNANRSTTAGSSAGSTSSDQSAKVAAALAEQGAFVGLRTQSIQLLRDAMYRACEGFASGAVSDIEFTAMQRRYQSTMLGLLAIEQLTRPVVASQVVLASNANAQAGASPGDAAVTRAQQRVDDAVNKVTEAKVAVNTAVGEREAAERKVSDNKQEEKNERARAINATQGDQAAKQAAADTAAQSIITARKDLDMEVEKKKNVETGERIKLSDAEQASRIARNELNAAKTFASATAGGSGQFGSNTSAASVQITTELVMGVKDIVAEINQSYGRDGCFALMQGLIRDRNQADLQLSATFVKSVTGPISGRSSPETQQMTTGAKVYEVVLRQTMNTCQAILEAEQKRATDQNYLRTEIETLKKVLAEIRTAAKSVDKK